MILPLDKVRPSQEAQVYACAYRNEMCDRHKVSSHPVGFVHDVFYYAVHADDVNRPNKGGQYCHGYIATAGPVFNQVYGTCRHAGRHYQ